MNEQNSEAVKIAAKHQVETKRIKNISRRRRGHSLPHFPQIFINQKPTKLRKSLMDSQQDKNAQPLPPRCQFIVDEMIIYVSNSKMMFSSQCKIQALEQLRLLSKTCKTYAKRKVKTPAAALEFKSQWNEMKNMMISDLNDRIQRQRSKCLSFFDQLTSSLEQRVQESNLKNENEGNNENETTLLLEQINHIQKNVETVSEQINGFKKIKEELNLKSYPDNKYRDLLTFTIQALTNFRDSFTHRNFLTDYLSKYENEMKEVFTSNKSDNNEGNNENDNEIEIENNNDTTFQKSFPDDAKNSPKQPKQYQQRKPSAMSPKEAEEYKILFEQNREIKSNLKRSLNNKRVLEKKKKELEEQYQDEIDKNQKTIKTLQKKKQAADSALQDLQRLTNDIQNLRENMKQLQFQAQPLRQSVDQLDNEGTRKVQEQIELIQNEDATLEDDIKNIRANILTNEEKIYFRQSIEKENKEQNQVYSIPFLIYNKENDIATMASSNRLAFLFPIHIDDPENMSIQYEKLKNSRQEQLDSLSKEKVKMKKQILNKETKLQQSTEELHNILNQIKLNSNIDKENKENKVLSLFQDTQSNLYQLRSQTKAKINPKPNTNDTDEKSLDEIRISEIKDEISIMDSEIKKMQPIIKNITKQTKEYRQKAKDPKVDALMNSYMEYLIQKRISLDSEYNVGDEVNKLISQAEAYNERLSTTINKVTDSLSELASRMLSANQQLKNNDPIHTLKELGGILRQNEIQKQKSIRQIGD